ncbi:MAG: hypothetical protein Q7S61_05585 [bacterium]|nr:hypothetical protein [bacterium]
MKRKVFLDNRVLDVLKITKPTRSDWSKLLLARVDLVKPYLNRFTLPTFGMCRVPVYADHGRPHYTEVVYLVKSIDKARFGFQTQGFFTADHSKVNFDLRAVGNKSSIVIYGLTRTGEWIQGLLTFTPISKYGCWNLGPVELKINKTDFTDITQAFNCHDLWREIGDWIRRLHEDSLERLETISDLKDIVGTEELLLR